MQKKLINRPGNVVTESLEGLALAHPHLLRVKYAPNVVCRKDAPVLGKVALISGSGSGHEPLNTGYVGMGMLDAACPGGVFTSPTPDQYIAATEEVYGGAGALYIMKNYMGGVLNMGMAMEMAAAEGYEVDSVLINDDVAVSAPENRRGMGATILVEKLAGAAAEAGEPLAAVTAVANRTIANARSMGVALTSCTSPQIGRPTFELPDDQIELGVGIHGERGRQRAPMTDSSDIVALLTNPIMHELGLQQGERVLALVTGLGATPQQELYVVFRDLVTYLARFGIQVERRLVGDYITSLDMAGCAITLLRLDNELIDLWDAPVQTPTLWW